MCVQICAIVKYSGVLVKLMLVFLIICITNTSKMQWLNNNICVYCFCASRIQKFLTWVPLARVFSEMVVRTEESRPRRPGYWGLTGPLFFFMCSQSLSVGSLHMGQFILPHIMATLDQKGDSNLPKRVFQEIGKSGTPFITKAFKSYNITFP